MTAEQSLPVFQGHDILKATGGTLIQGNPQGFFPAFQRTQGGSQRETSSFP